MHSSELDVDENLAVKSQVFGDPVLMSADVLARTNQRAASCLCLKYGYLRRHTAICWFGVHLERLSIIRKLVHCVIIMMTVADSHSSQLQTRPDFSISPAQTSPWTMSIGLASLLYSF
jgi:hypothetical protein